MGGGGWEGDWMTCERRREGGKDGGRCGRGGVSAGGGVDGKKVRLEPEDGLTQFSHGREAHHHLWRETVICCLPLSVWLLRTIND